jgi:hypothetical protein
MNYRIVHDVENTGPWIFKRTGRAAHVLQIASHVDHDVVTFRFCGYPGVRQVSPREFLAAFARLPERAVSLYA